MNRKYTKKQLLEAITYWKGQLRKLNEEDCENCEEDKKGEEQKKVDEAIIDHFVVACNDDIVPADEIDDAIDGTDVDIENAIKQTVDTVETYVFDNQPDADNVAGMLAKINGDINGNYGSMQI